MKTILKSSTGLSLVALLALPGAAFAQAACAPEIGDQTYPCTLPNGVVAERPLDVMIVREQGLKERVDALRLKFQQAERGVSTDPEAIRQQLEQAEARLDRARGTIKEMRAAAKERQAELDRQAADQAAAERQAAAQAEAARQADADTKAARKAARQAEREAERQAAAQAEADRQSDDARRAEKEARRQEKRDRRAARNAAIAALQNDGAATEVETEALTDENVRSSDEEFDTAVAGAGSENSSKKDDGLSKFEKALILGLGAVAVGQVLKNGDEVVSRSGDRVVVERDGDLRVLKNDDALLRQAGNDVRTETFNDGSTRTTVTKPNGARIVTIRSVDGTVLRRMRVAPDGTEVVLFDDTRPEPEIEISALPAPRAVTGTGRLNGEAELRAALEAQAAARNDDGFSLRQVREVPQVRALAPEIQLDAVRFASGSAAINPAQARSLARIGNTLSDMIARDPRTVLLVEGHTDAVGDATYNLALSDRRAESVALALTEYFDVPAENMIVQGYGESQLKVPTLEAEQANRRAVVRNITSLLR